MRLQRYDLQAGPGVQYGSTVLKALMATEMPGIDLLVREAIQNSLDAARKDITGGEVCVSFDYQNFDLTKLGEILDSTSVTRLCSKTDETENVSLTLRDTGTEGLSGPASFSAEVEDYGNLLKLVFSIGLRQSNEGAGGSWGFGKTVYFRAGCAPVMFYSRYLNGDSFRERLVFSYIEEHEDNAESLLENKTGFAWWGILSNEGEILPCEDHQTIHAILNHLEIEPFVGEETGTVIFLPSIRSGQIPANDKAFDDGPVPWWVVDRPNPDPVSLAEYTKIAIQKWYAPRIANCDFPSPSSLNAVVNGNPIHDMELFPLSEIIRDLHRVSGDCPPLSKGLTTDDFHQFDIRVNQTFKESSNAGKLIVLRKPKTDPVFRMNPPDNEPSPHTLIENEINDLLDDWSPVVAMTRGPGMIVGYKTHGDWTGKIHKDPEGYIVVSLFILKGDASLLEKFEYAELEEYIRQKEPPAHDEWFDGRNPNGQTFKLVSSIQNNIANKINNGVYPKEPPPDTRAHVLADTIGKLLLPDGFGRHLEGGRLPSGGGGGRGTGPALKTGVPAFEGKLLRIPFLINFKENTEVRLFLRTASEGTDISPVEWNKQIGTEFPYQINSVLITEAKGKKGAWRKLNLDDITVSEGSAVYDREIVVPDQGMSVKGELILDVIAPGFELVFHVK